jgi:hypothetical protein
MLVIAPFMRGRPMLRTWAALLGASVATYWVQTPLGYLAIDAVAAAIVVARPSGLAQKAIGALFVCMVLFDLGFYLSPVIADFLNQFGFRLSEQADVELFRAVLTWIGWVQAAILAGWLGHDAWGRYRNWSNPTLYPHHARQNSR